MSENSKTAVISAIAGIAGALVGSVSSGYFAYKIADVQFKQAQISTAAQSALTVRSTLAEKAEAFVLANQNFLYEFMQDDPDLAKVLAAARDINRARAGLVPYLDADLLIACDDVADSIQKALSTATEDADAELVKYLDAYKKFRILYLRLRRDLELHAQLNVTDSQISETSIKQN